MYFTNEKIGYGKSIIGLFCVKKDNCILSFSGCTSLTTIEIPDSIKSIGSCVFSENRISDIDLNHVETLSDEVI